jgi:fructokinase
MIRIGVDFGGTKIEAAAIDARGGIVARVREPNPGDYQKALETVGRVIAEVETQTGRVPAVGVGMPGSVSPRTGTIRNANSTWLNGRNFAEDLQAHLGKPVRAANDANCLALSEASDGAAAGARVVFAAILGTGVGGGLVVDGRLVEGRNGVGGEWGHTPLPWPREDEWPGPEHWCGKRGCLEDWVSGKGLERDFRAVTGRTARAEEIVAGARSGGGDEAAALDRYVDRLGRGLAVISDVVDPDVIVVGGGMSNVPELYERVPAVVAEWIFSDVFETPIVKAAHGDSSGVRGAAWLWRIDELEAM